MSAAGATSMRVRWLCLAAGLIGVTPSDARPAEPIVSPMPLDTMTFRDAESAGAVGAGCTWLGGPGVTRRVSMADDRAAVKRVGVVVAMRPASDARALFFTYDRWVGGGLRVVVRDTGRVVRRRHESSRTVAWLDIAVDGRTRSWRGLLDCGS